MPHGKLTVFFSSAISAAENKRGLSADEISGLELMDKELTKEELSDKTGILDVKLKLSDGTVIDIEISFSDRHPCLSENTSFAIRQNIAAA